MFWGRFGSCLIATKTVCWTVTNSPWPCTWWTSNWTDTTYQQSSLNISFHPQKEDSKSHRDSIKIRYVFIEFPSSARQSCSPQIKNGNPKILSWHHSCSSFVEVFLILRVISKQFSTLIIICYQSTNRVVVSQLIVHSRRPKASPTFICWA